MQQLFLSWGNLTRRQQIVALGATIFVFASVLTLSKIAATPTMQLLYSGLEKSSAGEVVRALEQRNVTYEVRGGAILVPAIQRDELRLTLASDGLPANGGSGYELLDDLNGFGTTSQMFDAAYWRAKEGELARTIVSSPHIRQARVHIANTGTHPFRNSAEASASVSITPVGGDVTISQANAVRHLIASAVSGLSAQNVIVVDSKGVLIGQSPTASNPDTGEDRAQILRERVTRLLEARVGQGNAVVEVSVDTVTESESIRQKHIDPASRVTISTEVEERADSSNSANGAVTVASNLPDGDAAAENGSRSNNSLTRERVNYDFSETEKEILRGPGAIRRITVAVLINGETVVDQTGPATVSPRSDAELDSLRELVSSAVGFDPDRGDIITLKSMELPAREPLGTSAEGSFLESVYIDTMSVIQIAALSLVAIILGLFVVRPILTRNTQPATSQISALPTPQSVAGPANTDPSAAGVDIPAIGSDPATIRSSTAMIGGPVQEEEMTGQDPVDRLRAMIGDRQDETVEILRGWLEEEKENAG